MNQYIEMFGPIEKMTRFDLLCSMEAVDRVNATMIGYYNDAPPGSEHEAWLLSRVKELGDYHVALIEELEKRKTTGSDAINCTVEEVK
jgi:hypothetical protein